MKSTFLAISPNWRRSRIVLFGVAVTWAIAIGGCRRGPSWELAPVEGTISVSGRPAAGIEVVFMPDLEAGTRGPQSSGVTDATGHYVLQTANGYPGAAVGRYRICLNPKGEKATQEGVTPRSAYRWYELTRLRAEVHAGAQTLDFDVKPAKKK